MSENFHLSGQNFRASLSEAWGLFLKKGVTIFAISLAVVVVAAILAVLFTYVCLPYHGSLRYGLGMAALVYLNNICSLRGMLWMVLIQLIWLALYFYYCGLARVVLRSAKQDEGFKIMEVLKTSWKNPICTILSAAVWLVIGTIIAIPLIVLMLLPISGWIIALFGFSFIGVAWIASMFSMSEMEKPNIVGALGTAWTTIYSDLGKWTLLIITNAVLMIPLAIFKYIALELLRVNTPLAVLMYLIVLIYYTGMLVYVFFLTAGVYNKNGQAQVDVDSTSN